MPSLLIHDQAKRYARPIPDIKPGFTVRVHEKIEEGDKKRTQIFEGLVIGVHRGHTNTDATFTVRRIASGVGVEKVFSFCSPVIEKIEVKKVAEVRRSKLNFLRGRQGKSARLNERFTTNDEFTVAIAKEEPVAEAVAQEAAVEAPIVEAPAEEKKE